MSAFNTFLSDDVKPDNTQGSVTGTGLFNNFLSDDVKYNIKSKNSNNSLTYN